MVQLQRFFYFTCLLLNAVLLSSCVSGAQTLPTPTPLPAIVSQEKDIFTVRRGPILSQKDYAGEVAPARQDSLSFNASGFVARVAVETGDRVKKGDLLAELQMDELLNQLQQARIELQSAQDDMANFELQHAYEIQKAESEVAILQIQLEKMQKQLDSLAGSAKEDALLEQQIIQERLRTAESWLRLVQEKKESSSQGTVDRNRLTVEQLEKVVAEHQILAPYDGIVLTSYLKPGTNIDAFSTGFLFGEPNELVIRIAYINELISVLEPSTEVYMSFSRLKEELYPVQYLPDFLPITNKKEGVVTNDPRQALTFFYFSTPEGFSTDQLPIGAGVTITVIYGRKDDALLLSPAAIRGDDDFKYVVVLEDDIHRRLELLKIGLKGDTYWEVEADLQEGDQILGP